MLLFIHPFLDLAILGRARAGSDDGISLDPVCPPSGTPVRLTPGGTILAIRGWLRRGPPQSRHERTPDTTNTLLITVCSASSTFVVAGRLKLIYLSSVMISYRVSFLAYWSGGLLRWVPSQSCLPCPPQPLACAVAHVLVDRVITLGLRHHAIYVVVNVCGILISALCRGDPVTRDLMLHSSGG